VCDRYTVATQNYPPPPAGADGSEPPTENTKSVGTLIDVGAAHSAPRPYYFMASYSLFQSGS
jgi:hypothetical protein